MRKIPLVLVLAAAAAMGQTHSRDFLNEGVKAFQAAQYAQAIELFQQAASALPGNPVPHLYLGTAYLTQLITGADTPDNR